MAQLDALLMKTSMSKVTFGQAHVVFDGAIDIVSTGDKTRSIDHSLNVGPELGNALTCLSESEREIGKVVDVSL